jgi:protease II
MPVKTTCEVVGVKQAINNLGKIDKQLQKDFKADATAIAQPAINAAKNVYKSVPLSGMQYKWTRTGSQRANYSVYCRQSG